MNPEELWETTMDPKNRILLKVTLEDAEKAEELAEELKSALKTMKETGNMDGISKVNAIMKEKNIDVKKLDTYEVKDLTELVDLAKTFM